MDRCCFLNCTYNDNLYQFLFSGYNYGSQVRSPQEAKTKSNSFYQSPTLRFRKDILKDTLSRRRYEGAISNNDESTGSQNTGRVSIICYAIQLSFDIKCSSVFFIHICVNTNIKVNFKILRHHKTKVQSINVETVNKN